MLLVFDLDETLFSRYFRLGNPITSHVATCSKRSTYYWINQDAWKVIIPEVYKSHDIAILTSSICHSKEQIKDAVFEGLGCQEGDFTNMTFISGNEYGDRNTPKGAKIIDLKEKNVGVFSKYELPEMLLIDDSMDHVQSAQSVGIPCVQAGKHNYFHDILDFVGIELNLPSYDTYRLGWNMEERRVTIEETSAQESCLL